MSAPELFSGYHDKITGSEIYQRVPALSAKILQGPSFASVEGFVFGGSYSSGEYQEGDDVDVDLLFGELPSIYELRILVMKTMFFFMGEGIMPHIRACIDRAGKQVAFYENLSGDPRKPPASPADTRRIQETLYTRYPNSPFIVRSEEIADFWHLRN